MTLNNDASSAAKAKIAKASEFMEVAEVAASAACYDSAVSLAVSAGINYGDALCLRHVGRYPSGANHEDVLALFRKCGGSGDIVARHYRRLLRTKTKAQYSSQRCTRTEAEEAILHARRIATAVENEVQVRGEVEE